jgi:hypothetical protein
MSEAWKKSHDWLQRSFTHNPYADRLDALNAIVEAVDAPVPLPDDSAPANMFGIGPRVRDPYGDPAEMAARRQEEQTVQTGMRFLGKVGEEMAIQIVLIPVTEFTFEFTFARIAAQLADLAAAERPLITVIGSLRDTEPFIGREGFNVLNVPKDVYESMTPEEFDALNTRWLQSAINRGDEIWLVTDPIKHAELMETLGTNSRYLDLELPLLEQTGSATAKNAYYLNWVE